MCKRKEQVNANTLLDGNPAKYRIIEQFDTKYLTMPSCREKKTGFVDGLEIAVELLKCGRNNEHVVTGLTKLINFMKDA